jgi:glycosyltransferase involved in cell wall biosynthesis
MILPPLIARLARKKIIFVANGSLAHSARDTYKRRLFGFGPALYSRLFTLLETINYVLADQLSAQSERAITFLGLHRYGKKCAVNGAMYIDTNAVTIKKPFPQRKNIVGYIGRFSEEKGVINLVKAIPLLLKQRAELEFLLVGEGPLKNEITRELKRSGCGEKVKLTGWVPAKQVPDYLNELKLLVLPSETEGLPAIVQQAMACGTPVLATAVGGVPDLISGEKTGFLLEDNSPECIAGNVTGALGHPGLEEIIRNARELIEKEYAYGPIVARCRAALNRLNDG